MPLETREWVRTLGWDHLDADTRELLQRQHPGGEPQIRAMFEQWRLQAEFNGDFDISPERLSTITAKTMLLWGERDTLFPVELALEMYRAIPNASLWVVPGQGHTPLREIRDVFAPTVLRFFSDEWPSG